MATVTLPDAVPDAEGVVADGVPEPGVPLLGGVVVVVPTPTLAVTVAATDVVSVLLAAPLTSVLVMLSLRVPAVVEKVTGTPTRNAPLTSKTMALMTLEPPAAGTVAGVALTATF